MRCCQISAAFFVTEYCRQISSSRLTLPTDYRSQHNTETTLHPIVKPVTLSIFHQNIKKKFSFLKFIVSGDALSFCNYFGLVIILEVLDTKDYRPRERSKSPSFFFDPKGNETLIKEPFCGTIQENDFGFSFTLQNVIALFSF